MAMAVSPDRTVTLFDLAAPEAGLQVTEYVPGFRDRRSDDERPFEEPLTRNVHAPPTDTATSVP